MNNNPVEYVSIWSVVRAYWSHPRLQQLHLLPNICWNWQQKQLYNNVRKFKGFCPLCRIWWPLCHSSKKRIWLRDWSNVTPPFCWISSQLCNQDLLPPKGNANAPTAGSCPTTKKRSVVTACQGIVWTIEWNSSFWYWTEWSYNWPISIPVMYGVTISNKTISTIGLLLTDSISIPTGSMGILGLAICGWSQVAVCGESVMHAQTVMASTLAFIYELHCIGFV